MTFGRALLARLGFGPPPDRDLFALRLKALEKPAQTRPPKAGLFRNRRSRRVA